MLESTYRKLKHISCTVNHITGMRHAAALYQNDAYALGTACT